MVIIELCYMVIVEFRVRWSLNRSSEGCKLVGVEIKQATHLSTKYNSPLVILLAVSSWGL